MKDYFLHILFFLTTSGLWAQHHHAMEGSLDTIFMDVAPALIHPDDSVFLLSDSLLLSSGQTLRDVVFHHTPFQIREYGSGMTAGISIRGSSPSHTQVVWNGIPLNSPLNGQTDLNILPVLLSDQVHLYRGGMSMLYGSGAMAGALILENEINQEPSTLLTTRWVYGSFGKKHLLLKAAKYGHTWSGYAGFDYLNDPNRFEIPEKNYVNLHAHRLQFHYNAGLKYHRGRNLFRMDLFHSNARRLLPGTLTTTSDSRLYQRGERYRFLWKRHGKRLGDYHILIGHLLDEYAYYHTSSDQISGRGWSRTWYGQGGMTMQGKRGGHSFWQWETKYVRAATGVYETHTRWTSRLTAGTGAHRRHWEWEVVAGALFLRGREWPLTGLAYGAYRAGSHFKWSLQWSSHYRLPSFNDLYWQPGGNPDLLPERNYEWEAAGHWQVKNAYVRVGIFYRDNRHLIRWIPQASGLWQPVNILSSTGKGWEIDGRHLWKTTLGKFALEAHYTYQTIQDNTTGKRLPYTPQFLWNGMLEWSCRSLAIGIDHRFQSFFYTDRDNRSYLHGYRLWNLHIMFAQSGYSLSAGVDNLFNYYYELMPSRPMPGRNFYVSFQYRLLIKK